jgi:hypothetical protein
MHCTNNLVRLSGMSSAERFFWFFPDVSATGGMMELVHGDPHGTTVKTNEKEWVDDSGDENG